MAACCDCSATSFVAEFARWLYFAVAVLSVANSFIHLHIQFTMTECAKSSEYTCIGRTLMWRNDDNLDFDTNKLIWRQIFSLSPDIFFDIWPPVLLSTLALLQHFDTFKCETISGDWLRTFLFIVGWQLFCVLGYGSNFGVVIGLIGLCGVAFLYFIVCILLLLGIPDSDVRDQSVLDFPFSKCLKYCSSLCDEMKKLRKSDAASVNPENDNDINETGNDYTQRLSVTQPGSVKYDGRLLGSESSVQSNNKNAFNPQYSQIRHHDGSASSDSNEEELKQNEFNTTIYNDRIPPPPPIPALPNSTSNKESETGKIEFLSDSDKSHDGIYGQPDPSEATPR